jgi:hypothetical protein
MLQIDSKLISPSEEHPNSTQKANTNSSDPSPWTDDYGYPWDSLMLYYTLIKKRKTTPFMNKKYISKKTRQN